ncbi:hypothetical protein CYMTET_20717, partial [Cymbomonas tetramitiformis]
MSDFSPAAVSFLMATCFVLTALSGVPNVSSETLGASYSVDVTHFEGSVDVAALTLTEEFPGSFRAGGRRLLGYELLSSGECTGYCSVITSKSECEAAQASVGKAQEATEVIGSTTYPTGCSFKSNTLYYGTLSSGSCSGSVKCICTCGTDTPTIASPTTTSPTTTSPTTVSPTTTSPTYHQSHH